MECKETDNSSTHLQFNIEYPKIENKFESYFSDPDFLLYLKEQGVKFIEPNKFMGSIHRNDTFFQVNDKSITFKGTSIGEFYVKSNNKIISWSHGFGGLKVQELITTKSKDNQGTKTDIVINDRDLATYRKYCHKTNEILDDIFRQLEAHKYAFNDPLNNRVTTIKDK